MFYIITDGILVSLIIISTSIIVWLILNLKKGRFDQKRKIIASVLIVLVAIADFTTIWASFIEPRIIVVRQEEIHLKNDKANSRVDMIEGGQKQKNQSVTIALFSDVHVGRFKKEDFVKKISKKIKEISPDLVLIAGDNILGPIKNAPKRDNSKILLAFSDMAYEFPTYAVMGNHEYNVSKRFGYKYFYDQSENVKNSFEQIGVKVLNNDNVLVDIRGQKFWLLGVDSVLALKDNLSNALKNTNDRYPKILLAHNPDIMLNKLSQKIDLVLAGHTHGGQMRLPFIGPIIDMPIYISQKYDRGLFRFKDTLLFITSGIGESLSRVRLFVPPEIVVLKIYW